MLLRTVLTGGHLQIKDSRTMQAGRHQTRITDGPMGLRRRIKGGPMITRRHHRRRIETAIMIAIEITTATGIANHITMCTQHQELL
jgi:hypothetical protein